MLRKLALVLLLAILAWSLAGRVFDLVAGALSLIGLVALVVIGFRFARRRKRR